MSALSASSTLVVEFLGLSDLTESVAGQAAFPLGVLYPYSPDLRRVCSCYDAMCVECPDTSPIAAGDGTATGWQRREQPATVQAFLASIAKLYDRIAFAPGHARDSVGAAFQRASDALAPVGPPSGP